MRQVPFYAIIGNGRIARHMCRYFDALGLVYSSWARAHNDFSELDQLLCQATHALILIKDSAIDHFIAEHIHGKPDYSHIRLIHFSGSLTSKYAYSAHPLQTFAKQLYELDVYQKIPFMVDEHAPAFKELLPGLTNPHYRIATADKPYYHALCVMANNFTTLLWQKFYNEMQTKFNCKPKDMLPFLTQTFINLMNEPATSLTGPIARQDLTTLTKNLTALKDDRFHTIFKAFVETFTVETTDETHQ